jgi:hypothetical protein
LIRGFAAAGGSLHHALARYISFAASLAELSKTEVCPAAQQILLLGSFLRRYARKAKWTTLFVGSFPPYPF